MSEQPLKQRVQEVKSRLVGGKPGARLLHHPAGWANARSSCLRLLDSPNARAPPTLWGIYYESLDRILVTQPVATGYRVVRVFIGAVVTGHRAAAPPSAETV